jgi:Tol biopolymer transport system component
VGLATALRAQQRFADAESLARIAVAMDSARAGDTRADRAQSTSTLAHMLLDRGEAEAAAPLFRRSLVLMRELHPEEHADVAAAIFDLAAALQGSGQKADADSLFRHGLGLYRRLLSAAAVSRTGSRVTAAESPTANDFSSALQHALREPARETRSRPVVATVAAVQIVFTSDRDGPDPVGDLGNQEIYVMNADGSHQRRLTFTEAADNDPASSPDGKLIAFTSRRDGGFEIFLMNVDGTAQRRLTTLSKAGTGALAPTWSPEGKRLAFRTHANKDIYTINIDGTGLTRISDHPAADVAPAWSPDGKRIAFVSNRDGNEEIYLMDPDGGNLLRLTHHPARDHQPSWSRDSRRIVFESEREGDREIHVMNADGSDVVRLTHNKGEDGSPAWSPDGRHILFHRRVLGHLQVYVMNADGTNAKRLTELSSTIFNGYPVWRDVTGTMQ